jgi:hypothetical protein
MVRRARVLHAVGGCMHVAHPAGQGHTRHRRRIMLAGNLRTGADRTDSAEGPQEADYWVAAPVLTNGWAILGEAEALVPVSSQRLLSFDAARDGTNNSTIVQMVVTGSVGETVTMLVADEFLVVYKVGLLSLPLLVTGSSSRSKRPREPPAILGWRRYSEHQTRSLAVA